MTEPKTISVKEAASYFLPENAKPWYVVSIYRKAERGDLDITYRPNPEMRIIVNAKNRRILGTRKYGGKRTKKTK